MQDKGSLAEPDRIETKIKVREVIGRVLYKIKQTHNKSGGKAEQL